MQTWREHGWLQCLVANICQAGEWAALCDDPLLSSGWGPQGPVQCSVICFNQTGGGNKPPCLECSLRGEGTHIWQEHRVHASAKWPIHGSPCLPSRLLPFFLRNGYVFLKRHSVLAEPGKMTQRNIRQGLSVPVTLTPGGCPSWKLHPGMMFNSHSWTHPSQMHLIPLEVIYTFGSHRFSHGKSPSPLTALLGERTNFAAGILPDDFCGGRCKYSSAELGNKWLFLYEISEVKLKDVANNLLS